MSPVTNALAAIRAARHDTAMRRQPANYDGVQIAWAHRSVQSSNVAFGQVRYLPGGYCGPRIQRDYQLVLLHAGSCRVRVDRTARDLRLEEVYLFRPGHREHFQFGHKAEAHHSWCSIHPGFLPASLRRELNRAPVTNVPCSTAMAQTFSAAFSLRAIRAPSAARVADSLALTLLAEFLDLAHHPPERKADESVTRAVRHMEEHLADSDCLRGAQRTAGCSVNALIYKFKAAFAETPARHLWRLRMEKGLALLGETGLTIAEIAERCGFKSPFHFSRMVRRHHGQSPSFVRDQSRRNR